MQRRKSVKRRGGSRVGAKTSPSKRKRAAPKRTAGGIRGKGRSRAAGSALRRKASGRSRVSLAKRSVRPPAGTYSQGFDDAYNEGFNAGFAKGLEEGREFALQG
ncbi:hypothetical protein H7B90_22350 [Cohnella xylanilytica]|uniref:Uncharacterized protein n=1 Tax=Cohnella xylanilytica TaxID=557555 RepID=A0A841U4W4_9BACL|nr:hypothetical protein [Cohnella xylanilytica]MBB6694148.1 hypothetical protein [Cohnella xylanilytica]